MATLTINNEACLTANEAGYLYNWWAAIGDTDGDNAANTSIANTGWRLPTQSDIQTLALYIEPTATSSTNTVAGYLKSDGTTYWNSPNSEFDDPYGFDLRGSGSREIGGTFTSLKASATLWLSNYISALTGAAIAQAESNATTKLVARITTGNYGNNPITGNSVRLIKESTTLTHGQTGSYEGNDGKWYRTICIGTQEWLSDNLKETKYRDGSSINKVTVNAEWAALGSLGAGEDRSAYCIFNNATDDTDLFTTTTTTTP